MNVMWAAILVGAVSIVIQTVLLFTMALNSRAMRKQVTSLVSKVEPVTETGRQLLQEVRADVPGDFGQG